MKIAFLGLGIMGRPMASNLVKAGHEVSVWNRTARQHVDGARTAVSPADAAKDADVVWICVELERQSFAATAGADGRSVRGRPARHRLAAGRASEVPVAAGASG